MYRWGILYAIFILTTGKLTKQNDPLLIGILQLGVAGGLGILFSFIFEDFSLPSSTNSWVAILGLGILCSAIGFIFQTFAQKYTTSTHTGLIFALEPIFAAVFAVLILNEVFTLRDILGCIITILGILIAQLSIRPFPKSRRQTSAVE